MSIPKEPRQQMINIMYLVLIALLAMNVSAEILNAFKILRRSIDNSNVSINGKIDATMDAFKAKVEKQKLGGEWLALAGQARTLSSELVTYLGEVDQKLVDAIGLDPETGDLLKADDQDTPTRMFVDEGLGAEVEQKINEYRGKFSSLFKDPKDLAAFQPNMTLHIDSVPPGSDKKDWVNYTFYQMPAQAVRTMLTKFKNDAISTEAAAVDHLFSKVGEKIIIFDRFDVALVPNSGTTLLTGEKFDADIYLAASSSMSQSRISVNGTPLPVDPNGKAKYTQTAGAPGEYTVKATILTKDGKGDDKSYDKSLTYKVVSRPDHVPVVSADKMNVFYIGVDNPITASITGIRSDDTNVSISGGGGSLTRGSAGKYTVRVSGPHGSEANVNLSGKDKSGSPVNGSAKFRVKRIPDPEPQVGGKSGGAMGTGEMRAQLGVAAILKDFDFDAKFDVLGYEMTFAPRGEDILTCVNSGSKWTGNCASLIQKAKVNSMYYFDNIKAKGPDGSVRTLPTIAFKIR